MADPNTRILVVDDTFTIRLIVRKQLAAAGYANVEDAADGEEALRMMVGAAEAGQPYGLVISDWAMPKVNGYELLRVVRGTPALADTAFLMLTSTAESDRIVMAIRAGVSGYLVKPIDPASFAAKIDSVLGKADPA